MRREGTPVPGSLARAEARFSRGYDGVFKPSSWCTVCAPTSEEAFIQARIYYGALKSSSLYSLTTINEKKKKKKKRVLVCLVCAARETRLAAVVLARMCSSAARGLDTTF